MPISTVTAREAKAMARRLRADLAAEGHDVGHSHALEVVAHGLGFRDWNTAAARLEPGDEAAGGRSGDGAGVRFDRPVPVLRIFDEAKAREFYCDFLGFTVGFEHRFEPDLPLYLEVERAGLALHLTEHHGDASPGATVFCPMTGLAELHAELTARHYRYGRPGVEHADWGDVVEVHDPFGNRLRFCERRPAR